MRIIYGVEMTVEDFLGEKLRTLSKDNIPYYKLLRNYKNHEADYEKLSNYTRSVDEEIGYYLEHHISLFELFNDTNLTSLSTLSIINLISTEFFDIASNVCIFLSRLNFFFSSYFHYIFIFFCLTFHRLMDGT